MSGRIRFDKKNFRTHSSRNKELIRKSLEEYGAGRSILLDSEGEIIAGNGVLEQANELGIPVRVVETDGTELIAVKRNDLNTNSSKRKKLAFADNAISDRVTWNFPNLESEFTVEEIKQFDVVKGEILGGAFREDSGGKEIIQIDFPITIIANKDEFTMFRELQEKLGEGSQLKTFSKILQIAYDNKFCG